MPAYQRENGFPQLHAAAALAGTYTASALLVIVDPKSVAGVPLQVLIPAGILLPFCASFIALVAFAPASFGLYWLMERLERRDLHHHCLAGVVCVAVTFAAFLFAGYVASLLQGAPEHVEATGLFGEAGSRSDQLFLGGCAICGMFGGVAFYFARKVGRSGVSVETAGGGRS